MPEYQLEDVYKRQMYGPESQPTFAELQGHGKFVTVVEEAYRRWMRCV